jgi:hypothetical protein
MKPKTSDTVLISNATLFLKQCIAFGRFPGFAFCPSDKRNIAMNLSMRHWWDDTERGKAKYYRKTCPSANLSTTNLTWNGLGIEAGRTRSEAYDKRPSHGTTSEGYVLHVLFKLQKRGNVRIR